MTILQQIKRAATNTGNDSIFGATVRRILEEERALEAMKSFDSNPNQYTVDQVINEVEMENRKDDARL
jgi:curli biogenesis system outer membrane secretion channel CsgG